MGKTVLKYIFAFCSLLLFISCGKISSNFTNDEVDYSDSKCWFEANQELDSYPYLRMAKDSTDVGVIIGFNSVTKPEAISPLFKNNIVCINPLNWKTDASPGVSYQGFTASIAPSIHTIVVTGIDEDKYYIPSVEVLLPKGNLHVEEFNLYNQNLRKNVLQRIRAFHERSFQSN